MTGVARVYRWEMAKLLAQKRTYLGIGTAVVVPIIFVVVLVLQTGGPNDVPLGRYIRDTGLAVPFVVLFFMSIWGLPLITALVAGDIVASESHNGTLKTILTRSRERGEVFTGKTLATATYTLALVFAMGLVGLVAGSLAWGLHPLTSLSGTQGLGRSRPASAGREPRDLRAAAGRDRRLRHSPLDRHPKQCRLGRRRPDVGAPDATPRCAARDREHPSVSARDAVRSMARPSAHTRGLGARAPSRLALCALHRHPARRRLHRLSPARRRG